MNYMVIGIVALIAIASLLLLGLVHYTLQGGAGRANVWNEVKVEKETEVKKKEQDVVVKLQEDKAAVVDNAKKEEDNFIQVITDQTETILPDPAAVNQHLLDVGKKARGG